MDAEDTMDERRLLRLLAGELAPEEAAALRRRVARDPDGARRLAALEATWKGMELVPPEPAPAGFAGRLAALAAERAAERRALDAAPLGPAWARAVAGAALVAGLAVGASLASLAGAAGTGGLVGGSPDRDGAPPAVAWAVPSGSGGAAAEWAGTDAVPSSLAESYWSALTGPEDAASGGASGASGGGEEPR